MDLLPPGSRREFLRTASCGIGYLALAALTQQARAAEARNPLAARPPHFPARARRVIFLFMTGGPSHVDTFDYKPLLQRYDGRPAPAEEARGAPRLRPGSVLRGSPWRFRRAGQSGLWISELFPHLARCADDLCLINSMHSDSPAHLAGCRQLHTGATTFVRPSLGSWVLYALGTENDSLPGFVTVGQLGRGGDAQNRGSAFLPATYQGTPLGQGAIAHLNNPRVPAALQQHQLRALRGLTENLGQETAANAHLEGVIESYELAFRMQRVAPRVLDLGQETRETHALYGIGQGETDEVGRNCLLARRLAEAGVRFIEVGCGGTWDHHARMSEDLPAIARKNDQPLAALLTDLKRRGMLEETLVLWGGEFGRLPINGGRDGRDHNNHGYTVGLAGGGVRGGLAHGRTDDFGFAAVHDRVHLHDLHATILHLLGLDHQRLTFRYSGRDFRLTDVHGQVVTGVLA